MTTSFTITRTIDLAAPAEQVWAVVADYRRDPQWRTGVIRMTPSADGPLAPGVTTDEELRFAGKVWHNAGVVTTVGPGHRFAWRTTSGAHAHGARSVEALDGARSRLRLELTVTPTGVERVLAPVLRRMLERNLTGDLERLRGLLEAPAAVAAA